MSRGLKTCPKCNNKCGVRSFNCKECGAGFEVQGVQYPDRDSQPVDENVPIELMRHIVPIKYDEKHLAQYGEEFSSWESLCKRYHIRYYTHRFDVDLGETKNYRLVKNNGSFKPIGQCRSLRQAIQMMIKYKRIR